MILIDTIKFRLLRVTDEYVHETIIITLQIQWDQLYAKGAINGLQITLQGKAGHLITVINDWEH